MKEAFERCTFRPKQYARLERIKAIIAANEALNMKLSVRQIYYVLGDLRSNIVENIIKQARMAGLIDWNSIEDRSCKTDLPLEYTSMEHRLESAVSVYRLQRRIDQTYYIELLTEKDTLNGVFAPLARKHHLPFTSFSGSSSITVLYIMAQRLKAAYKRGQELILIHAGDWDPGGLDMRRDIKEKLNTYTNGKPMEVLSVALTQEQVEEIYDKHVPLKPNDKKVPKYQEKHGIYGEYGWEVDALAPGKLKEIVEEAIYKYTEMDKIKAIIAREERDKQKLREMFKK